MLNINCQYLVIYDHYVNISCCDDEDAFRGFKRKEEDPP